ncbi:DEAD/DEAH box helicase family protein [Acinetobacter pittii]|uniref:DEAD/DEAH box helicase family protein n=1 Tax=Acinetobacter pittii TaxID=48296 RepID=UPI0028148896|nr:DEAD/DEAH box helicase family protein [Acinetobacter pittii]MDQ9992837.1 DEAD/DEAH box helicase family protein [Acinetobacter pittii]
MSILKLKPITKDTVLVAIYYMIDFMHYQSNIARFFLLIIHKQIELNLSVAKQALAFARQESDFPKLDEVIEVLYNEAIKNIDESVIQHLNNSSRNVIEQLETIVSLFACDKELKAYTTKKNKTLQVIGLKGIKLTKAKEFDPYAFYYQGEILVRSKHLKAIPDSLLSEDQQLVKGLFLHVSNTNSDVESVGEFRLRSRGPIVSTTGSGNDEFEASEAIRNDGEIGVLRDSNSGLSKSNDASLSSVRNPRNESSDGNSRASTNRINSSGGGELSGKRSSLKRARDRSIVQSAKSVRAAIDEKLEAQLKADNVETIWSDASNIDAALPYLQLAQRGDVLKTEKRLIEENKKGILFTNGTGTGKTFTGLGVAKRFINAGLKNILIVTLNDKIANDFVKSSSPLNIKAYKLKSIKDNGGDEHTVVVTTFANFGQNKSLVHKHWDLILIDEAHTLSQSSDGKATAALNKLRALTGHLHGFSEWFQDKFADQMPIEELDEDGKETEQYLSAYNKMQILRNEQRKIWNLNWKHQKSKVKVVFLSATPFSYHFSLDWAEGYLFDYMSPSVSVDDQGNLAEGFSKAREHFYMGNLGYRKRYGKLTRPEAKVDTGVLERQFAENLKNTGAMSGRDLEVNFDYDRKFILIGSRVGELIDEGLTYLRNGYKEIEGHKTRTFEEWAAQTGKPTTGWGRHASMQEYDRLFTGNLFKNIYEIIAKRFDYLARRRLLEAIKAEACVDMVKKHLALGRKVVIFHDYNEGGGFAPFLISKLDIEKYESPLREDIELEYNAFKENRPDLVNLNLDYDSPVETLKNAFPNALLFNGRLSKQQRETNVALFNTDDSGHDILILQSDAGSTGISLHDTTGKHQRVLINIGQPTKPAKLRQTEGRIYRTGQASNAIQRYLTTGTAWERAAFADTIAGRAETVDNFAKGADAVVSIKEALIQAYEEAKYEEPSLNDGIGGKAYDEENARIAKLTPFDQALTFYYAKGKRSESRNNREGKEWYATPEPLGFKMIEWAGVHTGDSVLEPSAGDGAIGRFVPQDVELTMIEPTESLASRAQMANTGAKVIVDTFESLESLNKYHAIVMNPPFGHAGTLAIQHIKKAFGHLYDGGRIVALVPRGSMDSKVDEFIDSTPGAILTAEIWLPQSTFKNAGTAVSTRIIIIEKHAGSNDVPKTRELDFTHLTSVEDLFSEIRDIAMPPRKLRIDEQLAKYELYVRTERSKYVFNGDGVDKPQIKNIMLKFWGSEVNEFDEIVMPYNKSAEIIKKIDEFEQENGTSLAA